MAADWRSWADTNDVRDAAPAGLQQQTVDNTGNVAPANGQGEWRSLFQADQSKNQPAWQTGGQAGSIRNGWDTPFYQRMFAQRDEEAAKGSLNSWYGRKDFTGVATWNGTKDASGRQVKFGDVYEEGQFRGNVLDPNSGYDENTAYTMLAQLTLDSKEQQEAYGRLDRDPTSVKTAVEARRDDTDKQISAWLTQQDYQLDVTELKNDWDPLGKSLSTFGAGAAGGAAIGATGFAATPIVGAVTTVAGALIGGTAALFNQDTLVDQAARASVQTGMAAEQFGTPGAVSTGLRTWGGVAGQAMSPLTNTLQGAVDAATGEVGDGRSEYYEMEDRPLWLSGLNLATSLGDAVLQFASPLARTAYMGTMGATVIGGVGQLTTQGGATFDDRRGDFHSPEDVGQWAAALGAVGIDALQLGGAGGITRAAQNAFGRSAAEEGVGLFGRVTNGLKGLRNDGTRTETIAGRTFVINEAGEAVSSRASATMLAPSEAIQWASTRVQALRQLAREGGAVTPDDMTKALYRASQELADGSNLAKTTWINAFGEGAEEAAQAILEPISHGWTPQLQDVFEAYLQGAAMGAGMSIGARLGRNAQSTGQLTRANAALAFQGQPQISVEEWNGMSPAERNLASAMPAVVEKAFQRSADKVAAQMTEQRVRSVTWAERLDDAVRITMAQEMRNLNPAIEGTYIIAGADHASVAPHQVRASLETVMELLRANAEGLQEQVNTASPEDQPRLQAVLDQAARITEDIRPFVAIAEAPGADEATRSQAIRDINARLELAWNSGTADDMSQAKAVTLLFSRDPNNSPGSFQGLLPQVSPQLTFQSGDGVLQVSQSILSAIDGDYDGDKMRQRVRFLMDDDVFRTVRLGTNMLGTVDGTPVISERKYETAQLAFAARDLYVSGPQSSNAQAMIDAVRDWLSSRFATVSNINDYADRFEAAVRQNGENAKLSLLRWLATERGDELAVLGENGAPGIPPFSNPYLALDGFISTALQHYAEQRSARDEGELNFDSVQPVLPGTQYANVVARDAAVLGQTLQQTVRGTDPFRGFQAVHYSEWRSPVTAAGKNDDAQFTAMVEFYEQVSGGMQQDSREMVFGKDEVQRRALQMLSRHAAELMPETRRMEAMAVLAGMQVPNIGPDGRGGFVRHGDDISFVQLVLREATREFERRDANILESRPEIATKYSTYRAMSTGEAFAEIFDSVRMIDLVGEAANDYGANLTFGQVKADYMNRNSASRSRYRERAKQDVRYDKSISKDLPYRGDELAKVGVGAYQIVTDALFEVSDKTLSVDAKGKVMGRLADRDTQVQKQLETSFGRMRGALQDLAKLYSVSLTKDGVPDYATIQRILDQNPNVSRSLAAMIPTEIVNVVVSTAENGDVFLATWLTDMLLQKPAEAAMTYFRQSLLAQIQAADARENPRESGDRLVGLVMELRNDQQRLLRFERMLFTATNVPDFMRQVNKEFQDNRAPFLAWHRDAAMFDPTLTQGGWVRQLDGAENRDAIAKFATAATRFGQFAEREVDQDVSDNAIVADLLHAQQQSDAGRDSDSIGMLRTLEKRITDAGKLLSGMGPAAMRMAPLASALGFSGDRTDKGKSAELYSQLGHEAARGEARTWSTGYGQLRDALTSGDAEDMAGNLPALARDNHRYMDDQGRVGQWTKLDARTFLNLWVYGDANPGENPKRDASLRPMLRAIIFPSAWELQANGGLDQQQLTGTSLKDLIEGRTLRDALGGKTLNNQMQYASIVEALARKHGGINEIQRMVADLLIAWTTKDRLEIDDLASMQDEAYSLIVNAIRAAAEVSSDELVREINDQLDRLVKRHASNSGSPQLDDAIEKAIVAQLDPVNMPEGTDPIEREARKRQFERMQNYFGTNTFEEAKALFTIEWGGPDQLAKQQELYQYVLDHPDLVEATIGGNAAFIRSLSQTDPSGTIPIVDVNETAAHAIWDGLSLEILAYHIENIVSGSSTLVPSTLVPSSDRIKYWNPTYKYLVDQLLDPASPVMTAAKEFRSIVLGGETTAIGATPEDLTERIRAILDPRRLGPWTSDIARQHVDAQNRIDSSGVAQQIARAGITYAKEAALGAATARTYGVPEETVARIYTVTPQSVAGLLNDSTSVLDAEGLVSAEQRPESLSFLNGRFLAGATLNYRGKSGAIESINLFEATIRPGRLFNRSEAARRSGYLATSVTALRRSIESALPEGATVENLELRLFHPADLPVGAEWANNLFFEGSVFDDTGDNFTSILHALHMSDDGQNVNESRAALKAGKKGKAALRQPQLPSQDDVMRMENLDDLYETIRLKTLFALETDLGHGRLDPAFYSAVFKDMKMRHAVRARIPAQDPDAEPRYHLHSADEVIAAQQAGQQIEGDQFELIALSPRVLRTLLGEQGEWGVRRPFTTVPTIDSAGVNVYDGTLHDLANQFMPALLQPTPADIRDTPMAQRSENNQLTARPSVSSATRTQHQRRLQGWIAAQDIAAESRLRNPGQYQQNAQSALKALRGAITSPTPQFTLSDAGIPALAVNADPSSDDVISTYAFSKLRETLAERPGATGWVYSDDPGAPGNRGQGLIRGLKQIEDPAGHESFGGRIVYGDLVVVDLESFRYEETERLRKATEVIRRLTNRGVTVALTDQTGARDLRSQLADYLLNSAGYESVAGARYLFRPMDPETQFATLEARFSRLAETRGIRSDSYVTVFHTDKGPAEENYALVNNVERKQQREVVLTRDLSPSSPWPGFNYARTDAQRSLVSRVLSALADDPAYLEELATLGETTTDELRPAILRAVEGYNEATGLPDTGTEFGPGDLIALVGPRNQVILYRHGYEAPSWERLQEQLATPTLGNRVAGNLAIYTAKQIGSATTHRGTIQGWEETNRDGLSLIERVPLQALGNKTVLERNGMKLIGISIDGSGVQLPDFGPLREWDIDYIISSFDTASKENYDGMVNTARNAFAYLGADFAPSLAKTFFGTTADAWAAMTPEQQSDLRSRVNQVLESVGRSNSLSISTVDQLQRLIGSGDQAISAALTSFTGSTEYSDLRTTDWAKNAAASQDSDTQITLAAVLYMLSPQARASHILSAPGFDAPAPADGPRSQLMPELFTGVFDRAPIDSPLRTHIFNELNRRLNNQRQEGRQTGYYLRQDWKLFIRNEDPSKNMEGYLQFSEAHSSGDNPTMAAFARDRRDAAQVSRQQVLIAEQALGATVSQAKQLTRTQRYIDRADIRGIATGADLFALMNGNRSFRPVRPAFGRTLTPAERLQLEINAEARRAFEQPIDTTVWDVTASQLAAFTDAKIRISEMLTGEVGYADRVDTWIRQWAGAPKDNNPRNQAGEGRVSYKAAMEYIDAIERNLQDGLFPTYGAKIPAMSYNDVNLLWQTRNASSWTLRVDDDRRPATTEADYINSALGLKDEKFDPMWLPVLNGFVNTFRNAGETYAGIPISVNELHQLKLLDPTTNQMVIDLDPNYGEMLRTSNLSNLQQATFENVFGGKIQEGRFLGNYPLASAMAKADRKIRRWKDKNNTGDALTQSIGDIRERGVRFATEGTTSNELMRILTNLTAANGMLNPWLYAAAPLEMGVRGFLEDTASFLMGEGTSGASQLAARATGGATSRYDVATLEHAKRTYDALGRNGKFGSMINRNLIVHPKLRNAGAVEKFTSNLARIAGRWQDPTYGQFTHTIARRYVEAALRHISDQGSAISITPNDLLTVLDRDPEFLEKNMPEVHNVAINTVASVRSMKPTVASLVFRGIVDPLSSNPRFIFNVPSTLMLKIPFLFLPYAFNVATSMLGLQGVNAVAALALQGRQPGKKFGKMQAFLQGVEYDPNLHGIDFLNETLEAVDLSGAFMRAGLTHTGLMALGMITGSLGLSGEDEEDKRRRREAEVQGAGYVYDPRELENDFRNADALFFDNLPDWIPFAEQLKDGVRMADMHWTLKQFISPLMGISKFMDTGNFAHVVWGFEDALGSMPLVNTNGFDDANQMAASLFTAAVEAEAQGTSEGYAESYGLILNGVMSLERMLFENAFVNSVYQASDRYDRDPWVMAERDGDGRVVRDNLGVPMASDALQQYLNPEGNVADGSVSPDWWQGTLQQFAENRASLALFGSLFTGLGDSNLWRQNMVAKERKIEKTALTEQEATDLILSIWDEKTDSEVLTVEGGAAVLHGLRMGSVRKDDPALSNIYLSFEMRQELTTRIMAELKQEGLDLGLTEDEATERMNEVWWGSSTNPFATPLNDVVWSKGEYEGSISYSPINRYRQLNTTYLMGPDGKPWATGIGRDKLNNFWGQAPLQRYNLAEGNMGVDERLNSTDLTGNINTGMRNLEKIDDSWANPTDEDIVKAIEDAAKTVAEAVRTPRWSDDGYGRYGYGGGGRRYGGGGGGGGGGYSYRLNSPERMDVTYARNIPYINADNPIIRRAGTLRRERFSSTRGRLNQWQ